MKLAVVLAVVLASSAFAYDVNDQARAIDVWVAYVGNGGNAPFESVKYVNLKTTSKDAGISTDAWKPDGPGPWELPLSLGEIRGWKTRVNMRVADAKAKPKDQLTVLDRADVIIFFADANPKAAKANRTSLGTVKANVKKLGASFDEIPVVTQVIGTSSKEEAQKVAKSLGLDAELAYPTDPSTGVGVFDGLKAASKQALLKVKNAR